MNVWDNVHPKAPPLLPQHWHLNGLQHTSVVHFTAPLNYKGQCEVHSNTVSLLSCKSNIQWSWAAIGITINDKVAHHHDQHQLFKPLCFITNKLVPQGYFISWWFTNLCSPIKSLWCRLISLPDQDRWDITAPLLAFRSPLKMSVLFFNHWGICQCKPSI